MPYPNPRLSESEVNGELDSVGIVIDAIEDSVGERRLAA
jgi:hypothetical protein